MSGGSSSNNSWTILTSEETAAETLRPLAAAAQQPEDGHTSAAGCGENSQSANGAESAERLPAEDYLASEETPEQSGDSTSDLHTAAVSEPPLPSSQGASGTSALGSDAVSQAEGLPEGPAQLSPGTDSSSDSYTLLTPPLDEPPVPLLSIETLGGAEFAQEETLPLQNGEKLHPEGEESAQHPKSSDLSKQAVYLVDQLVMDLFRIWARRLQGEDVVDSPVDSEISEDRTEKTDEAPDERRKRSLLAALEQIGRREEEEEEEEEYQVPQREEDSGFSVNKCILGAIILLGLGTIFLSGIFMDLDEDKTFGILFFPAENDYATRELKDAEPPGQQEWLSPEVPPLRGEGDSSELLNKLTEGNQHISRLQANLQAQKDELNVAKGQAAEGAKEMLHWEEVEKENSRLKTEVASLPVLQKENERMKKELESVPALQKELETLRSTVTGLKLSSEGQAAQDKVKPATPPPSGQPADSRQAAAGSTEKQARTPRDEKKEKTDLKREKYEMGDKKHGKERQQSQEPKDGGKKEWKKGKHEQVMFEKDKAGKQKKHSDDTKQWEEKNRKKEKLGKGDDGKPWKEKEGRNEWTEKSGKKERKEDKDWKKGRFDKTNEGKQWKAKTEKKDGQGGKDRGERHKDKEEWNGEKDWKKVKDGFKESSREKWEKNEKRELKGLKKDREWRTKDDKDHAKEGKGKNERKRWENDNERTGNSERKQWNEHESGRKQDKDWKRKDDKRDQRSKKEEDWKKRGQKEKKQNGEGKKDKAHSLTNKHEDKPMQSHGHREEHLYGDGTPPHTHRRPSVGQPEYWARQRDRLQHNPTPPQHCESLEKCAQAEQLLPVPYPEFQALLQTYLTRAGEAGVADSEREALGKLAAEFFKDGVFVHEQMSFQEFAEDVADILEDLVEGEDGGDEDSAIEEEMEGFEREVLKRFSVPGAREKVGKIKGEWRKESGQNRG
ncbi:pre-B-cell leukemia homeobox interacting protein 1b isoform 2-T2 [Menidia menidia]